jgi:hypothetical protein
MLVHFVFIGEGTSDDAMISHLESLCVEAGADEATGVAPDFRRLSRAIGHSVEAKLRAALTLEPEANLVFIHRDADGRDGTRRYAEIAESVAACVCNIPIICVVPVQETEAWLLLDESAIRRVVGRPNSNVPLDLPTPTAVERVARPKERLKEILQRASEATGRRLERIRQDFPLQRRALLQDLPTEGPIEHVPSWNRLRAELSSKLTDISTNMG